MWHGGDLAVAAHKSEEFSDSKRPEVNNYLLVLLIKLLSAVGNYCLDWDCVADCLNQAYSICLHRLHGEVNSTERASAAAVSNALENIVNITSGLREENLVKFMTSFVALSASDMELMQGNQYSFDAFAATELVKILQDNQRQSSYISFTQWGGPSYFSFSIVVSTAKLNCYRISSIWQMVTSHIRLVMSSRVCIDFCYCHMKLLLIHCSLVFCVRFPRFESWLLHHYSTFLQPLFRLRIISLPRFRSSSSRNT